MLFVLVLDIAIGMNANYWMQLQLQDPIPPRSAHEELVQKISPDVTPTLLLHPIINIDRVYTWVYIKKEMRV